MSAHVLGAGVRVVEYDVLVLLVLAATARCCSSLTGVSPIRTVAVAASATTTTATAATGGCCDGTYNPRVKRSRVDVVQRDGPQGAQAGQDLARLRVLSEEVEGPVEGGGHDFERSVPVLFSSFLLARPRRRRWW